MTCSLSRQSLSNHTSLLGRYAVQWSYQMLHLLKVAGHFEKRLRELLQLVGPAGPALDPESDLLCMLKAPQTPLETYT